MAVLRPGENPGDRAQIGEAFRAEAPRRPRPDVEQRNLFERARGLEIGDKIGIADKFRVSREGGAGNLLKRLVEFSVRRQRFLAFRLQRVLKNGRRQQLHLVGRRAAIGVFERDDLALLGDAETAADGASRLRGDGVAGRRAAARHRAAASMEEGDGDALLASDLGEARLRLEQLPVRRQEAAVLVGVGIADHHLLQIALPARRAAHDRNLQEIAHDRRRGAQIADRLEERHDRQRQNLDAGFVEEQPRLLGEQIDAEHVDRRTRHRQNESAEGFAVELRPHLGDHFEHLDDVARIS